MKFTEFLDIRYRLTVIELHKEFSFFIDGRNKGIAALTTACRWAGKWFSIPMLIGEFILIKVELLSPPVSPVKQVPPQEPIQAEPVITTP